MENFITLGKLIGLLFCPPSPLYFVFENSKNTRNELARPVMGTIFLVITCTDMSKKCTIFMSIKQIIFYCVVMFDGWSGGRVCDFECVPQKNKNRFLLIMIFGKRVFCPPWI